jgi:6-phospho-beta-glucosidase
VKVTIIGGGGFRTPLVYEALLRSSLQFDEFVLHDRDPARLERMGSILSSLAAEQQGSLPFRLTTSLDDAVEGAGSVLCAVRVGGLEGRRIDEEVPLAHGVVGQETTGPGGLAFALRTVPVVRQIAETVAARAPDAWFVNFTNPAGLVTEAAQMVLGDRAVGVCDAPPDLCRRVARALGRPYDSLWFDYVGLNHLGWLRRVLDRGHDVLPALLADDARVESFEEGSLFGADWLRSLGMVPNEYLYYYYANREVVETMRKGPVRAAALIEQQRAFEDAATGSEPGAALAAWRATRRVREGTYMREAWEGREDELAAVEAARLATAGDGGYAAVALAMLEGLAGGTPRVLILNVANRGALSSLDDAAVVEVPALVSASGIAPFACGALPAAVNGLVQQVKTVERMIIQAALTGSRDLALRAFALHPLVPSHETARQILAEYRERQPLLRELLTR